MVHSTRLLTVKYRNVIVVGIIAVIIAGFIHTIYTSTLSFTAIKSGLIVNKYEASVVNNTSSTSSVNNKATSTARINTIKNENNTNTNTNTNFPDDVERIRYDNVTNNHNNTTKDNKGETNHEVTTNSQQYSSQYHHVTLVVQLSGEFGNHLNKFVRGWGLAKLMKDEYNITSHILLRQQKLRKAKPSKVFTQKCFDRFRREDFTSYVRFVEEEEEKGNNYFLWKNDIKINGNDMDIIQNNLSNLSEFMSINSNSSNENIISSSSSSKFNVTTDYSSYNKYYHQPLPPVLIQSTSLNSQIFVDRYYELVRKIFIFDDDACCKEIPDPDESVFHYRNFKSELRKLSIRSSHGLDDLSPEKIATNLFGHLQPGDKIAITGRNLGNGENGTASYNVVQALEGRGLIVRVMSKTSPMEDFCFLKGAKKELVGVFSSSFVQWAAYLGNATISRMYQINFPEATILPLFHKGYSHPELKSRLKLELYDPPPES